MGLLPDWLTGYDRVNAEKAALADIELRRLNQEAIDRGDISAEQAKLIAADYASQDSFSPFNPDLQEADIDQTFTTAVKDNAKAIQKGAKDLINSAVWEALKSIPLVVWIGLFVFLVYYTGLFTYVKGSLAKK